MRLKNLMAVAVLMTTGVLLAGCNNDSNSSSGQPSTSTDDAFIAQVRQQTDGTNAMSETAEPIDITQINETMPEQSEPQNVAY